MSDKWFSYDHDDGFEIHAAEAEARERAEHRLSLYRDDAGDGWPEEVDSICYGRVGGRVVETERRPATEDDGIPGCDEYVDYALEETPDDRLEAALAGESAALERVAEDATKRPTVLVLRTCGSDMTSRGGFKWPASGPVAAPDWNPKPACGQGLHGLLWGEGDGQLLDWTEGAKWLVVEVDASSVVDLSGKVKFPSGQVVHCGDCDSATSYLLEHDGSGKAICGAKATAGVRGTATAGDAGTATAGVRGTATAGFRGTATAGFRGTATAGEKGAVILRWWDRAAERWRMTIGYAGEDGIEPGEKYRANETGRLVKVDAGCHCMP